MVGRTPSGLQRCLDRCRRKCACAGGPWCLLLLLLLIWILRFLLRACRKPRPAGGDHETQKVPSHIYRRPDPLIYDQYYLSSLGLAYTWDNPDIKLERADAPGVHVDAHTLEPGAEYNLIARVWNGSKYAPAPNLPVRFHYLSFGAGTVTHFIGETHVNLPALGAPGCPAFATVPWTTPSQAGHYCVQVELIWNDDQNPNNNLGQLNTDVKALNSPRAEFTFAVRNPGRRRQKIRLGVDSYTIPPVEPCRKEDDADARRRRARQRHDPERYPVPQGWTVNVDPVEITLAPDEEVQATVEVIAPNGFSGRQAFNVSARENAELRGGVTLYAEGDADG
jgi:hypothetical protein